MTSESRNALGGFTQPPPPGNADRPPTNRWARLRAATVQRTPAEIRDLADRLEAAALALTDPDGTPVPGLSPAQRAAWQQAAGAVDALRWVLDGSGANPVEQFILTELAGGTAASSDEFISELSKILQDIYTSPTSGTWVDNDGSKLVSLDLIVGKFPNGNHPAFRDPFLLTHTLDWIAAGRLPMPPGLTVSKDEPSTYRLQSRNSVDLPPGLEWLAKRA